MAKRALKDYTIEVINEQNIAPLINELESWGCSPKYLYKHVFCGFSIKMSGLLANWYKDDPRIVKIQEAKPAIYCAQQSSVTSVLDRIDQRNLPLSDFYTYSSDGSGTTIYLVDSGIVYLNTSNSRGIALSEFGTRLRTVGKIGTPTIPFDPFFDELELNDPENPRLQNPRGWDERGHGTFMAGLVGGTTYGVAKDAWIKSAKVFGSYDEVTTEADIIAGIDAVINDYVVVEASRPAVCLLSVEAVVGGADPETALETAVKALVTAGITAVVPAGNRGADVETSSPARLSEVITVSAVDKSDEVANFSEIENVEDILNTNFGLGGAVGANIGTGVDLFAPGVNARSTYLPVVSFGPDNIVEFEEITAIFSGTSISAALAAGVASLILENTPSATPAQVKTDIVTNATSGVITGALGGAPNLLLYSIFADHVVTWITPATTVGTFPEGYAVAVQLEATSAIGETVSYSLLSGTLPDGVTLSASGLISGVAFTDAVADVFSFTVRASDSSVFADRSFSITIADGNLPPVWVTNTTISVEEGLPFELQVTALSRNFTAGGQEHQVTYFNDLDLPYDWTITSEGIITGTAPTVINTDEIVAIEIIADDTVLQQSQVFLIIIKQRYDFQAPNEPQWITPTGLLGTALANDGFYTKVEAIDGDGLPNTNLTYHLSLETFDSKFGPYGSLPPGLELYENGDITGDPIGDDIFEFAVYVTDGANVSGRLFSIQVVPINTNQPPKWITLAGNIGSLEAENFHQVFVIATDPDASPNPLTYSLVGGTLPPGMTLEASTGRIFGTPTNVVSNTTYAFSIRAGDGLDFADRIFTLTIEKTNEAPEWITPGGVLKVIKSNQILNIQLEASDPQGDTLFYSLVGGIFPPNVTINTSTGFLSGPIAAVTTDTEYNFIVRVDDFPSNAFNNLSADQTFTIRVEAGEVVKNNPPTWITPAGALSQGNEGVAYYYKLETIDTDGPGPVQYIVVGGLLPPGLALNVNSGVISGFPSDSNIVDDTYNFVVRATDGAAFADRTFSIEIIDAGSDNSAPVWITPGSPASVGSFNELTPVLVPLQALDPDGDSVTYTHIGGTLPSLLTLNQTTGILTGTLISVAIDTTYIFVIRATDDFGNFADRVFEFTILNIPNIPPSWVTPGGLLASVNEIELVDPPIQVEAIDGDGPSALAYQLTSGALPPGLLLNASTGEITGSPLTVASDTTFTFDITVNDGLAFVARTFEIEIINVPSFLGATSDLSVALTGPLKVEWKLWNSTTLIDNSFLYEPADPDFGRIGANPADEFPKIFVTNRLHTNNRATIFNIFGDHHRTFEVLIGLLDFAVVRDSGGTPIYEVIFQRILDPQKGSNFDITNGPVHSEYDTNGDEEYISKNFDHLRTELHTLANSASLPPWMAQEQVPGDSESVIGYIPAIEVAYVLPGTSAELLGILNKIEIVETTSIVFQTTFNQLNIVGNIVDPAVNIGEQFVIDGITVTATGTTVFDVVSDINAAGIDGVVAAVIAGTEYVPGPFNMSELITGNVLTLTYTNPSIVLASVGADTILEDLGFTAGVKTETTFDADTTTFDLTAETRVDVIRGPGHQFVGRKLVVDRYLVEDSIGGTAWIKFFTDIINPQWVTIVGEVYAGGTGIPMTTTVVAESPLGFTITYTHIFGEIPDGLSLATDGEISGTPTTVGEYHFVIRATDDLGNTSDRGFDINIV